MKYYYLEGINKIGPLTIEELKQNNVNEETLIWFDGQDEWMKLKEIPDLKKQLSEKNSSPPPIPSEIQENNTKKRKHKKRKRVSVVLISGILLLFVSTFMSYALFVKEKEKEKVDILAKTDLIFQDKIVVCDGASYGVEGELTNISKPKKSSSNSAWSYVTDLNRYNTKKEAGIKGEFSLTSGGFSILQISKEDNGYMIVETVAKDMVYLVNKYTNDYGYRHLTNRPTVENCYLGAYKYLTVESQETSFMPNTYNKIKTFNELRNNLYFIKNRDKPTSPYLNTWKQEDGGTVFTSQYKIYLSKEFKYYEIIENKEKVSKSLISHLIIGVIIGIIFFLASLFISKRIN